MKPLFFLSLMLAVNVLSAQSFNYNNPANSRLGMFLNAKGITGVVKYYPIDELKGRDKMHMYFTAVEAYDNSRSQEVRKGIKVVIANERKITAKDVQRPFDQLEVVFDKEEYTTILIAIDEMMKQYAPFKRNNQGIEFFYRTTDNFKFGLYQEEGSMVGKAVIETDKTIISFEMKNVSKFLRRMKEIIENANQELYLPENAAKLKKAKSSKASKQVIDEDI